MMKSYTLLYPPQEGRCQEKQEEHEHFDRVGGACRSSCSFWHVFKILADYCNRIILFFVARSFFFQKMGNYDPGKSSCTVVLIGVFTADRHLKFSLLTFIKIRAKEKKV
jgi:hypothetical protein